MVFVILYFQQMFIKIRYNIDLFCVYILLCDALYGANSFSLKLP